MRKWDNPSPANGEKKMPKAFKTLSLECNTFAVQVNSLSKKNIAMPC